MNSYTLENFNQTLNSIESYLNRHGGHNTVAQNTKASSSTGFLCELIVEGHLLFLKIRIDEKLGFLLCDLFPLITVRPTEYQQVFLYCMEKNAEWKACTLQVNPETNAIFAHVESSFRDAPISETTFAYLETLLVSMLLPCYDELLSIATGRSAFLTERDRKNIEKTLEEELNANK